MVFAVIGRLMRGQGPFATSRSRVHPTRRQTSCRLAVRTLEKRDLLAVRLSISSVVPTLFSAHGLLEPGVKYTTTTITVSQGGFDGTTLTLAAKNQSNTTVWQASQLVTANEVQFTWDGTNNQTNSGDQ